MRWQRWAEGPQRHIYWGKGRLEIQAHCREQIRGIIGAEIPSGLYLSSPWTNALYRSSAKWPVFFLRNDSGRNRLAGNGAGTSQPPNHIIPPEANAMGKLPHLYNILLFIPDQQTQHSQSTRSWHTADFFAIFITKKGRCLQWLCTSVTLHFQLVAMALAHAQAIVKSDKAGLPSFPKYLIDVT